MSIENLNKLYLYFSETREYFKPYKINQKEIKEPVGMAQFKAFRLVAQL